MSETTSEPDRELEAMRQITAALQTLKDDEARRRVAWLALDKIGKGDD